MIFEEETIMANLYFPGCKVKGDFPAASEKLAAYIQSKRVVTPVGCCRVDHDKLTGRYRRRCGLQQLRQYHCRERRSGQIEFVWEIIDNDPSFPSRLPRGENDHPGLLAGRGEAPRPDAIRSLMRKMNIDVVELAENHERPGSARMNLVAPCNPSNAKLAPNAMWREGGHMFQPIPPEEQAAFTSSRIVPSLPRIEWSATANPAGAAC